jgi:hypothetical protein
MRIGLLMGDAAAHVGSLLATPMLSGCQRVRERWSCGVVPFSVPAENLGGERFRKGQVADSDGCYQGGGHVCCVKIVKKVTHPIENKNKNKPDKKCLCGSGTQSWWAQEALGAFSRLD